MLIVRTPPIAQPEKEYAFFMLFDELLGQSYRLEYGTGAAGFHEIHTPNGSVLRLPDRFSGMDTPWQWNPLREKSKEDLFAFTDDPFAAAFFMLSRWEEAYSTERDRHDRFPAKASQAWRRQFLHRPVVNEWADALWQQLLLMGWQGVRRPRQFSVSISCDVDHPRLWWSGADPLKTIAGALFRRFDPAEALFLSSRWMGSSKDPYDVFDEWMALFSDAGIRIQFNFMGERLPGSDCWYPLHHPYVQETIEQVARHGHRIGFHPGYESFNHPVRFQQELNSLRQVSPVPVESGRQHYLRFSVPDTWQIWESAGLKEDSTLGYPEAEGFRCGICHDYPVFDLRSRKRLQLREKPLIAMDVTLAHYRRYTPGQAAEKLHALMQTTQQHRGDFTLLWHNSSWNTAFWNKWKPVFRENLLK